MKLFQITKFLLSFVYSIDSNSLDNPGIIPGKNPKIVRIKFEKDSILGSEAILVSAEIESGSYKNLFNPDQDNFSILGRNFYEISFFPDLFRKNLSENECLEINLDLEEKDDLKKEDNKRIYKNERFGFFIIGTVKIHKLEKKYNENDNDGNFDNQLQAFQSIHIKEIQYSLESKIKESEFTYKDTKEYNIVFYWVKEKNKNEDFYGLGMLDEKSLDPENSKILLKTIRKFKDLNFRFNYKKIKNQNGEIYAKLKLNMDSILDKNKEEIAYRFQNKIKSIKFPEKLGDNKIESIDNYPDSDIEDSPCFAYH